jgi:hypothetical protein
MEKNNQTIAENNFNNVMQQQKMDGWRWQFIYTFYI